ncbi:VanW family protein [Thermoactinomyces vulgaris]|uniref:VanW family protein n=1 Tax=Thermoactinomyces TaxID=2023 RepID=UPI000F12CBCB|nr:VanW family protein [Thermoactinomyces vulgaris]RMA97368.1 VanW like protein [Thermoactinomyces vulgaris]
MEEKEKKHEEHSSETKSELEIRVDDGKKPEGTGSGEQQAFGDPGAFSPTGAEEHAKAEQAHAKPEAMSNEQNKPNEKADGTPAGVPQERGIRERIKSEIKNTPRPKKILVSTIIASMTVVAILGFGVYGPAGTTEEVAAVQTEEEKKDPAKLILQHEDKKYELDLWQLGYDGKSPESVDMKKLTEWLDSVRKEVRVEPKNARFENNRWGETLIKGEYGEDMDVEKMKEWLNNWHASLNQPYTIPMVEVKPEVTSNDLRQVDKNLIGSYTTKFNPGNVNRTTNMQLASNEIHNLVMLPGEKFSFNQVVGERTEARGYKTAHVIVKGEYTEGIGGGICQVSSTLYNSTDRAGLKMLRVVHHSADVDYVPKGRDATVSWGGPDFRFQNNLDAPILLRIFINGGELTANVYTVPGAKVKKRNVAPAPESFTEVVVDQSGKEVPQS